MEYDAGVRLVSDGPNEDSKSCPYVYVVSVYHKHFYCNLLYVQYSKYSE